MEPEVGGLVPQHPVVDIRAFDERRVVRREVVDEIAHRTSATRASSVTMT